MSNRNRRFHLRICLLGKENHLPAAAAPGKMGHNLPAFPLRQSLLRKSVKTLRVGMKFELGV
jgi:hypothetical protein